MTTISFVASDGENVLWDRLSGLFEGASVLRIASAFVGAHDDILFWVDSDSKRHVEVILRLEFPTNPNSVAALLKHPRVAIRAADPASNMPFHEKLFLAVGARGECIGAYIGSANWTQNGLRKNREAGVWLSEPDVLRQMRATLLESITLLYESQIRCWRSYAQIFFGRRLMGRGRKKTAAQ